MSGPKRHYGIEGLGELRDWERGPSGRPSSVLGITRHHRHSTSAELSAMYISQDFAVDDPSALMGMISDIGAAHIVTHGADGFQTTFMPLVISEERSAKHGSVVLLGHVARANPHWRAMGPKGIEALAIFGAPDGYVSPSWYPSKPSTGGRVVPTWNYSLVECHGTIRAVDEIGFVDDVVRLLTMTHEPRVDGTWRVDDAPANYHEAKLRSIVGVELVVERMYGKAKLSQNRPIEDRRAVIQALERSAASRPLAESMRRTMPDATGGGRGDIP